MTTSGLGAKAAPSLLSVADSSKRIIQIAELLEERSLSFSFCANRGDLLALCAMTLLYRDVDLKPSSKLMRDDERLVNSVIKTLDSGRAAGSVELRKVASMLISVDGTPRASSSPTSRKSSSSNPGGKSGSAGHSGKKSVSGSSSHEKEVRHKERGRRMTMPEATAAEPLFSDAQMGRQSFDSATSDAALATADPMTLQQLAGSNPMLTAMMASRPNLDYLSLGNTPSGSRSGSPGRARQQSAPSLVSQAGNNAMAAKMTGVSSSEWEALLGSMDGGMNNVYHAIYGGSVLAGEPSLSTKCNDWSPNSWDLTSFNIGDMNQNGEGPQSVLSISEESLSSGEEVAPSELGLSVGSVDYGQGIRPSMVETYTMEDVDRFSF